MSDFLPYTEFLYPHNRLLRQIYRLTGSLTACSRMAALTECGRGIVEGIGQPMATRLRYAVRQAHFMGGVSLP